MGFALSTAVLFFSLVVCLRAQNLTWIQASNSQALCNDYTRAGFFVRSNISSSKWIIFLESGSLCYSNDTCNRRFFNEAIQDRENKDDGISADFPYGQFDTTEAFNKYHNNPYATYVNPLMTSLTCFNASDLGVDGRDIMDRNQSKNPDFYSHNHIIIPYCSSDLWLGDEVEGSESCCGCFDYQPSSTALQFTFRGKIIFQSIFRQLMEDYNMSDASEILLSGSSAGGIGALNHAQWVRNQMPPETKLLILLDSSWFINFQESILRIFDGTVSAKQSSNARRLLSIISNNPACSNFDFGYPCCISAHCVMTSRSENGTLAYYPEFNQRTFSVFSLYDIFLLAPALIDEDFNLDPPQKDSFVGIDNGGDKVISLFINSLRTIGEYGGEMNSTVSMSFSERSFLSYYIAQCFQHVYLVTSTLWGDSEGDSNSVGGQPIFSSETDISSDLASFMHSIESGRWSRKTLANNGTTSITIQQAISEWYHSDSSLRFTDSCQGPYCNFQCPDEFSLLTVSSNNWPNWAKMLILSITFAIPILCIVMKILFVLWLFILERKQLSYLHLLSSDMENRNKFVLLECEDQDKISVSCLDLKYSITYKITKKIKDERKDETSSIVALHDLNESQLASEDDDEPPLNVPRRTRLERVRQTFRNPHKKTEAKKTFKASLQVIEEDEALEEDDNNKLIPDTPKATTTTAPTSNDSSATTTTDAATAVADDDDSFVRCFQEYTRRDILKGISLYFNPGNMIGIMGPSGCGKTTFLDILTGRRRTGRFSGNIFINGFHLNNVREWYISNTGYVLQLAKPYYAELTVRDNLTLAAQIVLGRHVTTKDKFRRVELVMQVSGLKELADTVVGGDVGPGLSGGQKRRLAVALQLLKMPSVVYLDEPTSGLDATSSVELLYHLDLLAKSGRTVILTIHQPRMEIFHMFSRLVLLSDGKVAYHGAPEKAYEVFVSALLAKKVDFLGLKDNNPADVIMDMLGKRKLRKIILEYYETLDEPAAVRKAVKKGINTDASTRNFLATAIFGAQTSKDSSRDFVRWAALEARAVKRLSMFAVMYLPFMFILLALVVGTTYIQVTDPALVVPAIAVACSASGLFVFPAMEVYMTSAIELYNYEKANAVGKAQDLILQGFIRYVTVAFFPVVVSISLIYLLVIKHTEYSLLVYIQILLVSVALNLTWTALLVFILMTFSKVAFRVSSLVSVVASFANGFFIPIGNIHWLYRPLAYINPNYYALSSVTFFLLENFNTCEGTQFECFLSSGTFILRRFFFDKINPYVHIVVLLGMTIFFILIAIFSNWVRHAHLKVQFKRFKDEINRILRRLIRRKKPMSRNWRTLQKALKDGRMKRLAQQSMHEERGRSTFLSDSESSHKVWKPKYDFSSIVAQKMKKGTRHKPLHIQSEVILPTITESETDKEKSSLSVRSLPDTDNLRRRQKTLINRVNLAWKVLQDNESPSQAEDHEPNVPSQASARWRDAAKKAAAKSKTTQPLNLSSLVSRLVAEQKTKENV